MKAVVISFGGSLIDTENGSDFLKRFSEVIGETSKDYRVFIVVGGGRVAREYIRLGRAMDIKEQLLDEIGIAATRLNASLVSSLLGANKKIPTTTSDAAKMEGRIIVMGGTTPGHSTDMVGAELAEKVFAERFIIATDVDGVYDKDPKKYKNAVMFSEIEVDKLIEMCGENWNRAGKNVVIDGPALGIIKRADFETFVVNGKKLDNLKRVIYGKDFVGTKIKK